MKRMMGDGSLQYSDDGSRKDGAKNLNSLFKTPLPINSMSGRRFVRGSENRKSNPKNLPSILSRKRKSDEDDPMQTDIQRFFKVEPKTCNTENFQTSQNIIRPTSRVPLGTISLNGEQKESISTPLRRTDFSKENQRRKQNWKKPRMRESWSQFRAFVSEPVRHKVRGHAPLPNFKWADSQLMWDLMAKRESGSYTRKSATDMLERHHALQPKMRAILLDWLIEVCEVYRLHRETFYLAVDFLDRYLGMAESVPKNRLQLVGVTCLFIGAKLEEIYPPKLQEFAYVTDGACNEEEILQMELEILKRLNWSLSPMTPNSWIRTFMQILHGPKKDDNISFAIPAYTGLPFSQVMQLMDLCMLDFGSLDFPYSILATSALYHIQGERIALAVSGYSWEKIARCVRWMSAFAFAIRERSPLQIKSFHGVAPEDSHHLQNHVVDLQLLERATSRLAALADGKLRESPDPSCQRLLTGLDQTPQEEEGDIMYPPSNGGSFLPDLGKTAVHPGLISPPMEGDYW